MNIYEYVADNGLQLKGALRTKSMLAWWTFSTVTGRTLGSDFDSEYDY